MSTFFSDGYQDALNWRPFSPPHSAVLANGDETNVFNQEYEQGYIEGKIVRQQEIEAWEHDREMEESAKADYAAFTLDSKNV